MQEQSSTTTMEPCRSVHASHAVHRIRKRDGTLIPFDQQRITEAVFKAMLAVETPDRKEAVRCSNEVCRHIGERFHPRVIPGVEQIQDIVEEVLIAKNHAKAAWTPFLFLPVTSSPRIRPSPVRILTEIDELRYAVLYS